MTYQLIAFDLDDTLAVTKSPISDTMSTLLTRLLTCKQVCIISGGQLGQFTAQVLDRLPAEANLSNLHLMPTCGTRYHRHSPDGWTAVYAQDLSETDKAQAIAALTDGAAELGLVEPDTWGPVIEDRGSQITFSALGQSAPAQAKYTWDPTGQKKEALRAYVAARVPQLEVRSGGSTSVDITAKGIDKAYGMRRLMEHAELTREDILFVGDRLDVGGNDRPVLDMGIDCAHVEGPDDTAAVIEQLLR